MRSSRLLTLSIAVVALVLLSSSVTLCDDLSDAIQSFDKEVHIDLCGPNNENVITSGPFYERLKTVVEKLGITESVYLLNRKDFNACASSSEVFVFVGLLEQDKNDNHLALVVAHEDGHIMQSHIRKSAEKKMGLSDSISRAIDQLNKPGYEENVNLARKIGRPLVDIFSLSYSREMEAESDTWGIRKTMGKGFEGKDALGLFDQMPSSVKGFLATLSDHPANQKRKKICEQIVLNYVPANIIQQAVNQINLELEPVDLAEVVKGNFAGYSFSILEKHLLLLVKGGQGEMKTKKWGNDKRDDRAGEVTIPADAEEAILLLVNPKQAFGMGFGMITFGINGERAPIYQKAMGVKAIQYVALTIPAQALIINDNLDIEMYFSKKPNLTFSSGEQVAITSSVTCKHFSLRVTKQ